MPTNSDPLPMHTMNPSRKLLRAFTLVELMVVVILLGIVSVSAIPAMNHVRDIRAGSARDDIVRFLEIVRGKAMASGSPHGLQIDIGLSTITIVELNDDAQVQPVSDQLTGGVRSLILEHVYPGVRVSDFVNGEGASGSGIVWFDFEGTPHTRTGDGGYSAPCDQATLITLSSGARIQVYPYTGLVEVQ